MKTLVAIVALLIATTNPNYAAPQKEWFLIFDTWFCDVHDCGEKLPGNDYVHRDSYATQKQCLAAGRRLVSDKTIAPRVFAKETSSPIGKIVPRCELYDGTN